MKLMAINTVKCHFLCTDEKISVIINLLFYLYFPPSFHLTVACFCPVGLSLLIQHFQQVLWVMKLLLSPGFRSRLTSTPTRPVENVVLTTKSLQDWNIQQLYVTTVENKGKQWINSNGYYSLHSIYKLKTDSH